MFRWTPFPMVRVVSFFIAGILGGYYSTDVISLFQASFIFGMLLLIYRTTVWIRSALPWRKVFSGLTGLLAVMVAGYLHTLNRTASRNPEHLSRFSGTIDHYEATVAGPQEVRRKSIRFEVEMQQAHTVSGWHKVNGKILLSFTGTSINPNLNYGDHLLVKGSPAKVQPPHNKGEFDYQEFLRRKNIFHHQFVKPDQFRNVAHARSPGILYYAQQARLWATKKFDHFIPNENSCAVVKALVLGVTDGIDNELQGAYAASGTLHVLSVSGLHVGIIYGLVLFLLKPFTLYPWSRWLIASLSIFCLWGYAIVTGLSPSVLRAVTMFSFVAVARPVARDTNIYNTLAASALLLLLYDPFLILSVGFQLSYLALLGILYLQMPLYQLWDPELYLVDKVWQLSTMSLAAQIATFPLGLYYFHQFPVYFMISNLIVIPLSSLSLLTGVVLLGASSIPVVSDAIGYLLMLMVDLLNAVVIWVEALPLSTINGVMLTGLQCVILMGIISLVIALLETRKFKFAVGLSVLVIAFCIVELDKAISSPGRELALDGKADMESTWKKRPMIIREGVHFFMIGNTSVAWIEKPLSRLPLAGEASILLISSDAVHSLVELTGRVSVGQIILDASNSPEHVSRLMAEAKLNNIKVHSVLIQGAFVLNK